MATATCFTASLVWDLSVLPALYLPTCPGEPSPTTGPLDLSSPSSLSSSASSSGEEDEGERPFSCPHCNRAFADRSNLRAHLQTHAEVKKYQCGVCARTFSRMSLLQKHSSSGCCSNSSTTG
ncbi:hypothetical protein CRUP_028546 [Coryphaenoides rupestris]|nr:hypothetical protein CRUP_028546 [Coryphaenoides rupestris]